MLGIVGMGALSNFHTISNSWAQNIHCLKGICNCMHVLYLHVHVCYVASIPPYLHTSIPANTGMLSIVGMGALSNFHTISNSWAQNIHCLKGICNCMHVLYLHVHVCYVASIPPYLHTGQHWNAEHSGGWEH